MNNMLCRSRSSRAFLAILTIAWVMIWGSLGAPAAEPVVDNARDIRSLLSDRCFACHGPDPSSRKANLRLDTREGLLGGGASGRPAVVPGKPDDSELIRRLVTTDADDRMPPTSGVTSVSAAEIARLRAWISAGAPWTGHWLFEPLAEPAVPSTGRDPWCRNPIDGFVLKRLRSVGTAPAADADPVDLIRRVTFDLTGLPPTPSEVAAFLADPSPRAFASCVDRLLASPRYGERMAAIWLDQVRYGDSIGYHSDNPMSVSPYRDYVISAFNRDLPFDQFTIEQLAGDLLPGATLENRVASAYNMLVRSTEEGGAQAGDYVARMAADRVSNVSSVWFGMTMMCAECHDHKYDPITQADFYHLAAFFADISEKPLGRRDGAITVPTSAITAEVARLEALLEPLRRQRDRDDPNLDLSQQEWERTRLSELEAAEATAKAEAEAEAKSKAEAAAAEAAAKAEAEAKLEGSSTTKGKPDVDQPKSAGTPAATKPAKDAKKKPPNKPSDEEVRLAAALRTVPGSRTQEQTALLRRRWRAIAPALADVNRQIAEHEASLKNTSGQSPQCLVAKSGPARTVRLLPRGNWQDESGPVMEPAVPAVLGKVVAEKRPTRLDLARWLTSQDNPVTPRVAVNRWWRLCFGHGLSRRMEDLGTQGELPTHPELLDWLAWRYRTDGWKTKALLKLMVTSRAYAMASLADPVLAKQDPDNRWYARQSRIPLEAEMVRDAALSIGGLLVERIGGPSVFPFQPEGFWNQLNFPARTWPTSKGDDLWRRSLYTHVQRSVPHPLMSAFDAPSREQCTAARSRTNSPQQALVLLNEPGFVAAARGLAKRILADPGGDPERLATAWQLALSRNPTAPEQRIALDLLARQRHAFTADPAAAKAMASTVGDPSATAETAAWTAVARTVLNLHATVTRY
ncbi:hypothetical protein LBMAG53_24490 [Planctomycetota bacterium]|nr:hypothetical protein LBMAG53_24490 [Planctomycetota bacterium]